MVKSLLQSELKLFRNKAGICIRVSLSCKTKMMQVHNSKKQPFEQNLKLNMKDKY